MQGAATEAPSRPATLPLFGVLASAVLLMFAARRYPGGYDWIDQSFSSLFQPTALNGAPNAARMLAASAVVLFCTSMAFVFNTIAQRSVSRFHLKTIRTAGIGAMVYTALLVTPMHDVLIAVALAFFVTAMVTIFHRLYLDRSFRMLAAGIACLTLTLTNATMYYGTLLYGFLPIVQKLSTFLWVAWLFALARSPREPDVSAAPDDQDRGRTPNTIR